MLLKKIYMAGLLVAGCCAVSGVMAQQTSEAVVLLEGAGIRITLDDLKGDLQQRIEPELHAEVLANEAVVRQVVSNLYVFRTLAQRAKEQGLGQDAVTQARIRLFEERVLGALWLADLDTRSQVDEQAAMAQALSVYKANPERFISQPQQVRARHILLTDKDASGRAKADDLLKQLKAGADFEEMARKESKDPGSAVRGGDLGAFGRGKMVPEFENAVFALTNPGDFAEVVESQFGLHIIQLQEHLPQKVLSFAEVSDQLVEEVKASKNQTARVEAADAIRGQAKFNEKAMKSLTKESSEKIKNKQ